MRGNPHAAFDVAGAGNVAWSRWCDTRRRKSEPTGNTNFDLNRRASPRPYLGAPGGEIPPGDSTSIGIFPIECHRNSPIGLRRWKGFAVCTAGSSGGGPNAGPGIDGANRYAESDGPTNEESFDSLSPLADRQAAAPG